MTYPLRGKKRLTPSAAKLMGSQARARANPKAAASPIYNGPRRASPAEPSWWIQKATAKWKPSIESAATPCSPLDHSSHLTGRG